MEKLAFTLMVVTWGVASDRDNGLGFLLPDQRFCGPCSIHNTGQLRTERSTSLDNHCKSYAREVLRLDKPDWDVQRDLIYNLKTANEPSYWIFQAYLSAKILFEFLLQTGYTLKIFVSSNNNDVDCLTATSTGIGFKNVNNVSETQLNDYRFLEGERFERDFIAGILDFWTMTTCDKKNHHIYAENAKERFTNMSKQAERYNQTYLYLGQKPIGWSFEKPSSLSTCGDPFPAKSVPSMQDESTSSTVCDFSLKRKKILSEINSNELELDTRSINVMKTGESCSATIKRKRKDEAAYFISEIHPCVEYDVNRQIFIEIRKYPPVELQKSLPDMKLIVLSTITLRIVTVVKLVKLHMNQNGYLPIFSDNERVHVSKDDDINRMMLPCSNAEPFAVILLQKTPDITATDWNNINLVGARRYNNEASLEIAASQVITVKNVRFDFDGLTVIRNSIVDAYIYGKLINQNVHPKLLSIFPWCQQGCNFVLSPGNPNIFEEQLLSINACPENDPTHYDFMHGKLGPTTPGSPNHCILQRPFQYEIMENTEEHEPAGVTINPTEPIQCPSSSRVGEIVADIEKEVNLIKRHLGNFTSPYYPVETLQDYSLIRNLYQTNIDENTILPFEIVPAEEKENKCDVGIYVRCKVCHERIKLCSHDQLSKKEGIRLPTQDSAAMRLLKIHIKKPSHYFSILRHLRQKRKILDAEARTRYARDANDEEKALAAAFLITYTIITTNTAFMHGETWKKTISKLTGESDNQWHSRSTTTRFVKFISSETQSNILNSMMANDKEFTFLLDASSDKRNRHYILFFVQTVEGEYAMSYIIGMYALGKSSTASAYLTAIQDFVKGKGPEFETYFRKKCLGLITDGAKTMEKLQRDFNNWIEKRNVDGEVIPILELYCISHRLQLITRNSIIPLRSDTDYGPGDCMKYFAVIEKLTQTANTFIKLGSRRIAEFRETAIQDKLPRYEMIDLHTERWISSEHRTIKHFLGAWITSTRSLEKIISDATHYAGGIRTDASNFLEKFYDKRILIIIVYLQDYTSAFKVYSEWTQKFSGMLIEHEQLYNRLKNEMTRMEVLGSPVLLSFLQSCKCSSSRNPSEFGCSLEEYENSESVTWRNQTFTVRDSNVPQLSVIGPALIKKTQKNFEKYIPAKLITSLGILHPTRFSPGVRPLKEQGTALNETGTTVYGKNEIEYLATILGLDVESSITDWAELIESMLSSSAWEDIRRDPDVDSFWARSLKETSFTWTELSKSIIRSAKAISSGTAVVESAFSMFNVIKNQRRSHISDENLFAALSVIINGPGDVDTFDAYNYANLYKDIARPSATGLCSDSSEDVGTEEYDNNSEEILDELNSYVVETELESPTEDLNGETISDSHDVEIDLFITRKKIRNRSMLM